uniref:Uncharacterized protein n=1 Tax=Heliothis virescens TaxID=7102 RepID=A0A2A4IXC8_HELVI
MVVIREGGSPRLPPVGGRHVQKQRDRDRTPLSVTLMADVYECLQVAWVPHRTVWRNICSTPTYMPHTVPLFCFIARLHEFSDLMGHYDLIDIEFSQVHDEDPPMVRIIEETLSGDEDEDSLSWPLVVHLSEKEAIRLKTFLEETPQAVTIIQQDSLILIPQQSDVIEEPERATYLQTIPK